MDFVGMLFCVAVALLYALSLLVPQWNAAWGFIGVALSIGYVVYANSETRLREILASRRSVIALSTAAIAKQLRAACESAKRENKQLFLVLLALAPGDETAFVAAINQGALAATAPFGITFSLGSGKYIILVPDDASSKGFEVMARLFPSGSRPLEKSSEYGVAIAPFPQNGDVNAYLLQVDDKLGLGRNVDVRV